MKEQKILILNEQSDWIKAHPDFELSVLVMKVLSEEMKKVK